MPAEIEEGGTKQMQANQMPVTRQTIEDFLFAEAALLDAWQLEKWLELFREDALYLIPPTDEPQLDRHAGLYLVMDDMRRLRSRVAQILGRSMWAENPVSRTRRLIGNVRILAQDADVYKRQLQDTGNAVPSGGIPVTDETLLNRGGPIKIVEAGGKAYRRHEPCRYGNSVRCV